MKLIPMFVYGTLRPGRYNAWYSAERIDRNCTTNGQIFFVSELGGFPVAKLDAEGTIIGDVIWLEEGGEDHVSIDRMERGAGYEMRSIQVCTPEGRTFEAYAWHYKYEPMGPLIEDGDWVKASEALYNSTR